MAKGYIEDVTLTAIADKIRKKTMSNEQMLPVEMAELIDGICGKYAMVYGEVTVTPMICQDAFTITHNMGVRPDLFIILHEPLDYEEFAAIQDTYEAEHADTAVRPVSDTLVSYVEPFGVGFGIETLGYITDGPVEGASSVILSAKTKAEYFYSEYNEELINSTMTEFGLQINETAFMARSYIQTMADGSQVTRLFGAFGRYTWFAMKVLD